MLNGFPVTVVINEHYQQGQMTSVHAGMNALSKECDGIMVCLSDQPLIEAVDINALIRAFEKRTHGAIVIPTYQGQRGNPIIMASEYRQVIVNSDRNLGCKRLIEKSPELASTAEMNSEHFVFDMDTPADYAEFKRRFMNSDDMVQAS
ncbi:MAG: nucleotidyltransferase family protein [Gammaproteobacteria bacterium]|nr:nucleotidyltransferase family protein [Gammaproteobacteria bacterium]